MDQVLSWRQKSPLLHSHIAGDLHHPLLVGMRCHPDDMHLAAFQVNKEQHVVGNQSSARPHFGGEKIGRYQHRPMGADKFFPRRRFLSRQRWRNTMTFEDITHRLVADGVAQLL